MRILAVAIFGSVAMAALPIAGRADTVDFKAPLASEADYSGAPADAKGSAALSLDTATKTVRWTIEYSGLARPPQGVGCGALDSPSGPAIWLTSNLASPITGSKTLTDPQIAALAAGRWVCVLNGDEAEIGGVLKPAR